MEIRYENCVPIEVLNTMRKTVGWAELSERQLERAKNNSEWAVSAFDGDKVVATARAVGDGGYHYLLVDVIVLPEYQGMGIGRAMLEKFVSYVKSTLQNSERVMITLCSEKGKEEFYKKFGFSERPDDNSGAGMCMFLSN